MWADNKMLLVDVVRDDTMKVPAFGRQIYMCSTCRHTAWRLVFSRAQMPITPLPVITTPPAKLQNGLLARPCSVMSQLVCSNSSSPITRQLTSCSLSFMRSVRRKIIRNISMSANQKVQGRGPLSIVVHAVEAFTNSRKAVDPVVAIVSN
jgi:hypothetical protein